MLGQIKFKNIKHQKHLEKNILIQILGNFCEITPNFWSIKPPKLIDKSRDEPMEIQTPRQVRVHPNTMTVPTDKNMYIVEPSNIKMPQNI